MSNEVYVCVVMPEEVGQMFKDPETGETYRISVSCWSTWEKAESHGMREVSRSPGAVYAVRKHVPDEYEEKPSDLN